MIQAVKSFEVFKYDNVEDVFTVTCDEYGRNPRCSCYLMEFMGIPCCHLIVYLNYNGFNKIPDELIKDRWLKGTKNAITVCFNDDLEFDGQVSSYIELSQEANDVVNDAIKDERLKDIAHRHFKEAREEM